ncbi:exodeoxyribonuclease V subunit alpha [Acinetobacter towneri]|uniref:exodeoxyribonuclease V subunit alpha n=1 Tax=Acinetobacter towneri TaxID=202956 RepID=UPI00188D4C1E|nr:exodeoxyribonuclease V subunit alpha [Acinetobacter towneri]
MQAWLDYLCQPPFSTATIDAAGKSLMQQVLDAIEQGDSCIPASAAQVAALHDLQITLPVQPSDTAAAIAPFVFDGQRLYLYRYWKLEQQVATDILRIQAQQPLSFELKPEQLNLLQDPQQQQALQTAASQSLSIITGGPGTGKTYTLAHIIAVLNQALPDIRIAMAAPTGKAAQRMQEALKNALSSKALQAFDVDTLQQLQPVTLHRLLGLGNTGKPRFHAKQPLPYDVIVVDEASMLDLHLSHMLLAAIPAQARLILLGDANQLASVDVGTVLADLQQVPELAKNRVNLVTTRRFAEGAKIGAMAKFIQQEHSPAQVLAEFEQQVVAAGELKPIQFKQVEIDALQLQYLPQQNGQISAENLAHYYDQLMYGYQAYVAVLKAHTLGLEQSSTAFQAHVENVVNVFDDYRILTAIRHGHLGLQQLNLQIEKRLLQQLKQTKHGDWYAGRPVMMTYNDYQLGLSNGDIGICFMRTHNAQRQFEVYFPSLDKWVPATRLPKNIETAFALTIHKSQGSEFSHTAVVLDAMAKNLLSKELIYTAITRAKKVVSLLVDAQALEQALSIRTRRSSGLLARINEVLNY